MRTGVIIFLIFLFPAFLRAEDPQLLFQTANEAYAAKDYAKAIENYESILKTDFRSAEVEYNLGNAYYRTQNLGKSVFHYERALLLEPYNKEIAHNLAFINEQLVDQMEAVSPFFLKSWWRSLRDIAASSSWAVVSILLLWIGIGGIVVWLRSTTRKQKKLGFSIGLAALLLAILPFFLAKSRAAFEQDSQAAVILSLETELRNGAALDSRSIRTLHSGLVVDLLDQIGEWYKVRLPNGEQGWLAMQDLEKIKL